MRELLSLSLFVDTVKISFQLITRGFTRLNVIRNATSVDNEKSAGVMAPLTIVYSNVKNHIMPHFDYLHRPKKIIEIWKKKHTNWDSLNYYEKLVKVFDLHTDTRHKLQPQHEFSKNEICITTMRRKIFSSLLNIKFLIMIKCFVRLFAHHPMGTVITKTLDTFI